jgi:HEAT repeat protein
VAALALGAIGDDSVVDPLLVASGDPQSTVRRAALLGLGAIGAEEARDGLLAGLNAGAPEERWAAAWSLGHLPASPRTVEALLQSYWGGEPDERLTAAAGLRRPGVGLVPNAARLAQGPARWRRASVELDVAAYLEAWLPPGPLSLPDPDGRLLEDFGAVLLEVLSDLLERPDPSHLRRVLDDLDGGDRLALGLLVDDGDPDPGRHLAGVLGDGLSAPLSALLSSPEPGVRGRAASVVVLLETPSTTEVEAALTALLQDPDEFVRRRAATALGRLSTGSAAPALLEAADREGPCDVRSAAVDAVGSIGAASAQAMLASWIEDDACPSVRGAAARALVRLGSPDAAERVGAALSTSDGATRVELVRALALDGSEASRRLLRQLAEADPSPAVRWAAQSAVESSD